MKKIDNTRNKVHKVLESNHKYFFLIKKNTDITIVIAIIISSGTDPK